MNRRGQVSSLAISPAHEQQCSLFVGSLLQCMHLHYLLFCLLVVLLEEEGREGGGREGGREGLKNPVSETHTLVL